MLGLSGLVPTHKLLKRLARLHHKWDFHGRDPLVAEYLAKVHHDHLDPSDQVETGALESANSCQDNSLSRDLSECIDSS
jgi:hypothetical protein